MSIEITHCCGAHIYQGISYGTAPAYEHLVNMALEWEKEGPGRGECGVCTVVMFDVYGNNSHSRSDVLKEYIERKNLGEVTTTPWVYNPKSGNRIRTMVWLPERGEWADWLRHDLDAGVFRSMVALAGKHSWA